MLNKKEQKIILEFQEMIQDARDYLCDMRCEGKLRQSEFTCDLESACDTILEDAEEGMKNPENVKPYENN